MAKKEFEIGEEFHFGLTTLKCVEATQISNGGYLCNGCVFNYDNMCGYDFIQDTIGPCGGLTRKDGKSVIFIKVEK